MIAKLRLLPGERFADRFVIERLLGEGAMARVYVVQELAGGPRCALKILRPHIADEDPKALERFSREAAVGSVIGSEHVVEVLASGVHEERPWLLMELLEGLMLHIYLDIRHPDPSQRWSILDQLFATMALAHRAGIIHRDLKCENVIVLDGASGPFVKLLDFGVTKTFRKEFDTSLTHSGLGTPMWAAPEQGVDGVRLSPSCDVWALGLLTFFVLTSRNYWRHMNIESSSAVDIAVEVLRAPIEAASTRAAWLGVGRALPPGFDAWFQHCVNRDPLQRFETAAAARAALHALTRPTAPR